MKWSDKGMLTGKAKETNRLVDFEGSGYAYGNFTR